MSSSSLVSQLYHNQLADDHSATFTSAIPILENKHLLKALPTQYSLLQLSLLLRRQGLPLRSTLGIKIRSLPNSHNPIPKPIP